MYFCGGGRSPQHIDQHQEVLHVQENHHLIQDVCHERSPVTQMDQDGHMTNEPHLPHGAPLTPQLTPVSQMSGSITPIASTEGETIKTEVGVPSRIQN